MTNDILTQSPADSPLAQHLLVITRRPKIGVGVDFSDVPGNPRWGEPVGMARDLYPGRA